MLAWTCEGWIRAYKVRVIASFAIITYIATFQRAYMGAEVMQRCPCAGATAGSAGLRLGRPLRRPRWIISICSLFVCMRLVCSNSIYEATR